MELLRLYEQLETLLGRLDVRVRCEPFDSRVFGDLGTRGGLCTLRGKRVVLVDARNPLVERVAVLAQAAAQLDTESVFVTPAVREAIRTFAQGVAIPDARPAPDHGGLRLVHDRRADEGDGSRDDFELGETDPHGDQGGSTTGT